jgi:hypothetical protein
MGVNHLSMCRHRNNSRTNHFFGIEMPSLGVIADYTITKVSYCPFTALSIDRQQGQ